MKLTKAVDSLSARQMNELADRLVEETAHRGLLVRLATARTASELRRRAALQEERS